MTLRELLLTHPHLFYGQTWYLEESFLDRLLAADVPRRLPDMLLSGAADALVFWRDRLPYAVTLAALYVQHPTASLWNRYLWCADADRWGQRVYMGGVCPENGNTLEIHRHLHITDRWGIPAWL